MVKRLAGFPVVDPKDAGCSAARLEEFRKALHRETHEWKSLPGAAHIILHKGRCVFSAADGWANVEKGTRFGLDTLCALHGATKPIVLAAFLTLVDEKKVRLSDPIDKYVKFSSSVSSPSSKGGKKNVKKQMTKPVKSKATIRHLLTMTSGLSDETTLEGVRRKKIKDLAGLCDSIGESPLLTEPGASYEYGLTAEVLGRICEVVAGEPLDKFVKRRVLDPLGMKDTHFVVPESKLVRKAVLYNSEERERPLGGALYKLTPFRHPESAPGIFSPGGGILSYKDSGMYSTVNDYARFCQMLVDDGKTMGGARILKASTMKDIWRDGLAPYGDKKKGHVQGWHDSPEPEWAPEEERKGFWNKNGWTILNTHVVFADGDLPKNYGPARKGKSMWMGGGGGAFWTVDPKRKLVAISIKQCFGGRTWTGDGLVVPLGGDVTPVAVAAFEAGADKATKKSSSMKN